MQVPRAATSAIPATATEPPHPPSAGASVTGASVASSPAGASVSSATGASVTGSVVAASVSGLIGKGSAISTAVFSSPKITRSKMNSLEDPS